MVDSIDTNKYYKKNLEFWETAWSRVKKPYKKLAPLDYLEKLAPTFKDYKVKHILDMACGSGWLCFYLNGWGFDCTGIDISPSAIELAESWSQEGGDIDYGDYDPNICSEANDNANNSEKPQLNLKPQAGINKGKSKFFTMDMMNMDFPENHFDGILMNAMFEHLDYKRGAEFLSYIKRFIKPNGVMFAVYDKVNTADKGEFVTLDDGTRAYTDKMRDGMFLRYYPDDELKALLEDNQWQIESWSKNDHESRVVVALNKK